MLRQLKIFQVVAVDSLRAPTLPVSIAVISNVRAVKLLEKMVDKEPLVARALCLLAFLKKECAYRLAVHVHLAVKLKLVPPGVIEWLLSPSYNVYLCCLLLPRVSSSRF